MSISIFVGTRPEAIKLAPVILNARKRGLDVRLISTGQHPDMLMPALRAFGLAPDIEIAPMGRGRSLHELFGHIVSHAGDVIAREQPAVCVVQGDTASVLAVSIACFYANCPVVHVEAGLRTHVRRNPFPEEMHRAAVAQLVDLHCAPTVGAKENLLREGIQERDIRVTGNTAVDAVTLVLNSIPDIEEQLCQRLSRLGLESLPENFVLLTGHRRENAEEFEKIFRSVRSFLEDHDSMRLIFPVHLNPTVQDAAKRVFGSSDKVWLIPPVEYDLFVFLMKQASVVVSDSGGIQEEIASIGTPLVITRVNTERSECLQCGFVALAGTGEAELKSTLQKSIEQKQSYRRGGRDNPFGDGMAADKICEAMRDRFVLC